MNVTANQETSISNLTHARITIGSLLAQNLISVLPDLTIYAKFLVAKSTPRQLGFFSAEDLASETITRCLKQESIYNPNYGSLLLYTQRVCHNIFIDLLRKNKVHVYSLDDLIDSANQASFVAESLHAREAPDWTTVYSIPKSDFPMQTITLREYTELFQQTEPGLDKAWPFLCESAASNQDLVSVASAEGYPIGTVKTFRHRLVQKLRWHFGKKHYSENLPDGCTRAKLIGKKTPVLYLPRAKVAERLILGAPLYVSGDSNVSWTALQSIAEIIVEILADKKDVPNDLQKLGASVLVLGPSADSTSLDDHPQSFLSVTRDHLIRVNLPRNRLFSSVRSTIKTELLKVFETMA